jgi:hypothetical protein
MKLRRHMVLVVGGGTALVLMLVALFMLYRFYSAYDRVNGDLQSTMSHLRGLQDRAPYPSSTNVSAVGSQLTSLNGYFDGLFSSLRQGQIEPVEMEAAKFTPLLRDGILRVNKRAQDAGVLLPTTFAMGVERYKLGALPSGADVPRLVVQLKTLEALCDMLIDAKVTELLSVTRQVFEQGAESREAPAADFGRGGRWGPGGGMPVPEAPAATGAGQPEKVDPSGLFSVEHYTIEFKCHERSMWQILNTLARSKLFAVVTSVAIVNDNPVPKIGPKLPAQTAAGVMPGSSAPAAAPAAQSSDVKVLSQEERVVAGREVVKVVLDVDVYRFLGGEKQEAKL